jgi:cytochrome c biogenesis protein CcmG/thiol:disulfide interchange protein DsbE
VLRKRSRKRNIIIFVVVSALNIALLALLANQLLTPAQSQNQGQPGALASNADSLGDVSSPLLGKMAPDFTLSTLKDKTVNVRLTDFKGKPVILNFWASWCDPCKEETPFLQKSWAGLKAQGVVLIGIDGQDNAENAQQFLQQYGVSYPSVQDTINGSTAINYGVLKFPETLFIDRNGVVVGKWSGELNDVGLKFEMKKLLR